MQSSGCAPRSGGSMTAFQTSAREPRCDGSSVLLIACRWVNHQLDLLNRRSERPHRMHRHPEMSHNYVVLDRLVSNCHVPVTLERDSHSLAVVAEVAYAVGTNDGSATAADARNGANMARNCLGTAGRSALNPSAIAASLDFSTSLPLLPALPPSATATKW